MWHINKPSAFTKKIINQLLVCSCGLLAAIHSHAQWHVYIDADRTGTRASGIAIEQGIRTALAEVNNQISGQAVELIIRDHRGSSPRSKAHLKEYLNDPKALAVFSGLHSPPLLANRQFINDNRILVLDPWAAAGPITRPNKGENWIFRLSVDDSKAGEVIAKNAIIREGFKKPYLLLEETGWGKSNKRTMTTALNKMGVEPVGLSWFHWNVGDNAAKILLRKIAQSGADVVFFVGNAPEGKSFARAMTQLPNDERLPIRSHWGITGGDFPQVIDADMRDMLDLAFIQTRFSFINHGTEDKAQQVLATAKKVFPKTITSAKSIQAPTGFIHAYDLTKILLSAAKQVTLTKDINSNRVLLHKALENLQSPVNGLIKTYQKPFTAYSKEAPDAHEALSSEDFVMARYGKDNEIILQPAL